MGAEELEYTIVGSFADAGADAGTAVRLVWEVVGVTCTEDDDWIVLDEFEQIFGAWAFAVAADVHTPEAVEVDTTVKNKIILTSGSADVMRIMVWGTKKLDD